MSLFPLVKGVLIGLSIAVPVGPIGLLCIRRTLADGRTATRRASRAAPPADFLYGCVAGFGLTALSGVLNAGQFWLGLIGGLFLCYLGVKTFLSKLATVAASVTARGVAGAYASTLALTLTNPATIFLFAAIFAGLGVAAARGDFAATGLLVAGVFLGSASWWLVLSYGVSLLRARVTTRGLRWLNWGSGVMIGAFGVAALALAARTFAEGR